MSTVVWVVLERDLCAYCECGPEVLHRSLMGVFATEELARSAVALIPGDVIEPRVVEGSE